MLGPAADASDARLSETRAGQEGRLGDATPQPQPSIRNLDVAGGRGARPRPPEGWAGSAAPSAGMQLTDRRASRNLFPAKERDRERSGRRRGAAD